MQRLLLGINLKNIELLIQFITNHNKELRTLGDTFNGKFHLGTIGRHLFLHLYTKFKPERCFAGSEYKGELMRG